MKRQKAAGPTRGSLPALDRCQFFTISTSASRTPPPTKKGRSIIPPLTSWLSDRLPDLVGSPLAANGGSQFDRIRRLAGVEDRPTSPVRPLAAAMMASLLVAVLVTAATQPREARADELPADTNKIESLTVEQAQKLVETFPGADVTLKRSNDNVKLEDQQRMEGRQRDRQEK